jgi:hypothetical protein
MFAAWVMGFFRWSGWVTLGIGIGVASAASAGEQSAALELREIGKSGIGTVARPVPRSAVRVFAYEGAPREVKVTEAVIAVDYGRSGVSFDRSTGLPVRHLTVADGWPIVGRDAFGLLQREINRRDELIGPGVLYSSKPLFDDVAADPFPVAVSASFLGRTWQARQPRGFLEDVSAGSRDAVSWTSILRRLNAACYVERGAAGDRPARRFTMANGLASNIVVQMAVASGTLWAACADIYDPQQRQWGAGGLCQFDPKTERWRRINAINGWPVRWVTLLQAVGDDLWVGLREGEGVAGDSIVFGMGIYPEHYRPNATALVLARLSGGRWTRFTRPLRPDPAPPYQAQAESGKPVPPTEAPRALAISEGRVLLFSTTSSSRLSGNWDRQLDGYLSALDPASGSWRLFDAAKDFDADELRDLVYERGEVLVTSNRGVHRWLPKPGGWRLLDPGSPLKNPAIKIAPAANDLWVGYGKPSFGVVGEQGISRYLERDERWDDVPPARIGTACPTRAIAAISEQDVWVLFRSPRWMGSAVEYHFYPREIIPRPEGLAHYAGGRWEFPVKIEGIPEPVRRAKTDIPAGIVWGHAPNEVQSLVAVGRRVFVATGTDVFAGPGPWTKILSRGGKTRFESPIEGLLSSEDGKALLIVLHGLELDPNSPRFHNLRYDLATGKVTEETWNDKKDVKAKALHSWWLDSWVRVAAVNGADWAVGTLEGGHHQVAETASAIWIAGPGELIRLDREQLMKCLEDRHE